MQCETCSRASRIRMEEVEERGEKEEGDDVWCVRFLQHSDELACVLFCLLKTEALSGFMVRPVISCKRNQRISK